LLGYIELYFGDESGFTLQPYVPYAWQKKGQTHRVFSRKGRKRLNVLGLMSLSGQLTVYHSEQSLDGEFVKNSLDNFSKKSHQKPRVIVLDNGPIHHAGVVKDSFDGWAEADMHLFYLPTYSPHLNPIEILWRFCKYKWLHKVHYKTWAKLKKAILTIFKEYGSTYSINFRKLIIKNTLSNVKLNSA
jgi:transposase